MTGTYRSTVDEGLSALAVRDMERAATLLREAAGHTSAAADFPWIALANAELALGRRDAAEAAVDRQLEFSARELGALLLKGMLREQASDARAASTFYRTASNQAAAEGDVPRSLRALYEHAQRFIVSASAEFEAHLRQALEGELSPAMEEAVQLLTGKCRLYLQEPSVFYFPGLPQRRFFDPAEFPWLEEILGLLPAMRDELAAIIEQGGEGFTPYVERRAHRPAPNNPLLDSSDWSAFHFWRDGVPVEDNAARCPATMAALDRAPMPEIAGRSPNAHWSRLLPGTHITPHTGMLNTRLICHIPIMTAPACWLRVGSETRSWEERVPLIFDDSIEHEARNEGPQQRVVLLFEIWRPEVSETDRAAIGRIFEAIGEYGT